MLKTTKLVEMAALLLVVSSAFAEVEKITLAQDKNEVVLRLTSNPSTGYSWQPYSYDTKVFKKVDHSFIPGDAPPGRVGVPGTEEWIFVLDPEARKEQAGTSTRIVLQYQRSGEKGEPYEEKNYEIQFK